MRDERVDRFFLGFLAALAFLYVLFLCISCGNESQQAPHLRRAAYDPVYVQLNNEQFERLIEALTKSDTEK